MKPLLLTTYLQVLPLLQEQQVADTTSAAVDSLAADSLAADSAAAASAPASATVPDTSDAIGRFSRDIGEAADLLIAGEWELFIQRLYVGAVAWLLEFIPLLLKAIIVFVIFFGIYKLIGSVLSRVLSRSRKVDRGLKNLLVKTYRLVALTLITVLTLSQFGINVTALLAGLSIAGVAIAFAARDTLENFISGVTILLDRPFSVGDNVEIDGTFGTVEDITLRSTRVRTLNNMVMVLPNIQMVNQKLINHTMMGTLRVEILFGIAYKEDPNEARKVALKLTKGDRRLHPDFPPQVVVTELGDSSVNMSLRVYIKNPKLEVPVRFEYTEKVFNALGEAGIEIPFPHLQLFIDEAKAFQNSVLMEPRLPLQNGRAGDGERTSEEEGQRSRGVEE